MQAIPIAPERAPYARHHGNRSCLGGRAGAINRWRPREADEGGQRQDVFRQSEAGVETGQPACREARAEPWKERAYHGWGHAVAVPVSITARTRVSRFEKSRRNDRV